LRNQLLQPERLETVLAAALDRREEHAERRREHIAELNKRATESELRLKRLYDAIEAGVADLDDPALKDRIDGLKAIRDQAKADAERAQAMLRTPGRRPSRRRCCASSPRPPASASGWKAAAIAATTCARSRSASRSPRARFGSWDRSPGCYRRLWREVA
jgi:site-specific DNA recombinase